MLKLLSSDLRKAEHRITDLAQKPVRERLAEALLFLRETYGTEEDKKTINVVLTREELANIVGTATETTIRLLSDFKTDGIIELIGKKIRILDAAKLLKTANMIE
jgi:CRP/FNR family transcriptional regulator